MPKIYKYTKLEYAKEIIETNTIKVSHPSEFNDPFDSSIKMEEKDINKAINIIAEYLLAKSLLEKLSEDKARLSVGAKFAKAILKCQLDMNKRIKCYESNAGLYLGAKIALCIANKKDTTNSDTVKDQFEKEVLDKIYELKDKSLIGCFSKRWDSILMWSHYADCHKGVCIEFERPNEGFLDVEYSKQRKSFDLEYAIRTILGHELAKQEIDSHDLKIVKKLLAPYFNKYIDWQ